MLRRVPHRGVWGGVRSAAGRRFLYTKQTEKEVRRSKEEVPGSIGMYTYMRKEDAPTMSLASLVEKNKHEAEKAAERPTSDEDAVQILHDVNQRLAPSRVNQHYKQAIKTDLMYMTYWHADHVESRYPGAGRRRTWDMTNPYHRHRSMLPPGLGGRGIVPNPAFKNVKTIPELKSITLSFSAVQAVALNPDNIAFLYMLMSSLTGEPVQSKHPVPYGAGTEKGIVPVRVTRRAARFKIRPGTPISAKVTLTGHAMYSFLEMLVTFVMPRLRADGVIQLPRLPTNSGHVANYSGAFTTILPASHLRYFPTVEYNLDRFPPLPNLVMTFQSSTKGRGAPDQLLALLSGLGVPFVKRRGAKKGDRVGLWT